MVMNNSRSGMSRALVRRETTAGYLFLLPSLFFFLTFVVYPMVMCIITSFFDSNMGKNTQDVFIGFGNYISALKDASFMHSFWYTALFAIVSLLYRLLERFPKHPILVSCAAVGSISAIWLKWIMRLTPCRVPILYRNRRMSSWKRMMREHWSTAPPRASIRRDPPLR